MPPENKLLELRQPFFNSDFMDKVNAKLYFDTFKVVSVLLIIVNKEP